MALRAKNIVNTTAVELGEDIYIFGIHMILTTDDVTITASRKGHTADTIFDTAGAESGVVSLNFARGLGPYDTITVNPIGNSNVWIYYDVKAGGS